MLLLLAYGALALAGPVTGQSFIALARAPQMYFEDGRPASSRRVLLHRLVFDRESHGVSYFRLQGGDVVKVRAINLYRSDALVRLVETRSLSTLRRRYLGHSVWFYGGNFLTVKPGEDTSSAVSVAYDQPLRIVKIFQLAAVSGEPPALDSESQANRASSGGTYAFVYDIRAVSPEANAYFFEAKPRSDFFRLYPLDMPFDQLFSLMHPSPLARRAVARRPKGMGVGDITNNLRGLSHWEIAWVYGFPMENKPLSDVLREREWHFWSDEFRFSGDKLVYAFDEMSH